ncbi:MAG TPA: aminoacetone oxidase family FAD-binding enzyme [Planctomycetota bacterium]|nr:aminoacetone oxidase family FAD-binding enzyme [Planctomycetota bacterium]
MQPNEMDDVAVIGAGGAGILAAIAAAREGAKTVLYERMKTPARKVAISGGGRCNFSNTLDPRQFVKLFGDKNANFLGNALRILSNKELIALLQKHGVEGQVERNYRLYTKSGRGMDVVNALINEFRAAGGRLITSARITSVRRDAEKNAYVLSGTFNDVEEQRLARTVIVCTGGLSYPVTGSTGDGYDWARTVGHGVTRLRPALVGLAVEEQWTRKLQGLAWPDARVTLYAFGPDGKMPTGKALSTEHAEILFTHFGLSGPAVIDTSNTYVASGLSRAQLCIDYFPSIQRDELDKQVLERFKQHPGRTVSRALEGLMPARLLEHLEAQLGEDGKLPATRVPKAARLMLLDMLKNTRVTVTGTRGIEFGEVTAGGIELDQIDASTMESRLSPGLYFAGEILDLTGRCGGFNLQAAFSTGYLAGQRAARKARSRDPL